MNETDARALAERLLASPLPQRWRHVRAVAAEAVRLCQDVRLNHRAVVCAAWLHDIGYAPAVADTGYHPLDGARYLRTRGWEDDVCRLVAHHTDAASQAEGVGLADQLRAEFPQTEDLEQAVLWTADVTTGPSGERFTLDERITEIADRYGSDHPVTARMIASRPVLEAAIRRVASASR